MHNTNTIVDLMKEAARNTMEASKPLGIFFGTVETVDPISVRIDQRDLIESSFLLLTSLVSDFTVEMTMDHSTESATHNHGYSGTTDTANSHSHPYSGTTQDNSHDHKYAGKKQFTVHLGLQVGEKVLLVREQGGQRYLILDRERGKT